MKTARRMAVGVFAEGSRATDPYRDHFRRMWERLANHCGHRVELKVFPFDKGQLVQLRPEAIPIGRGATALAREKHRTQLVGGGEALDVLLARTIEREHLDRVIVAFDRFPSNQLLTAAERNRPCPMRSEVGFVLEHLSKSTRIEGRFRASARVLLERYLSEGPLERRSRADQCLEVVFMDPMFEAIFVSDEATVRRALGFESRPKDWPKFKTRERALDKVVLEPAVRCTRPPGSYRSAKARWGLTFVEAAGDGAALWQHPIVHRLCRTIAA